MRVKINPSASQLRSFLMVVHSSNLEQDSTRADVTSPPSELESFLMVVHFSNLEQDFPIADVTSSPSGLRSVPLVVPSSNSQQDSTRAEVTSSPRLVPMTDCSALTNISIVMHEVNKNLVNLNEKLPRKLNKNVLKKLELLSHVECSNSNTVNNMHTKINVSSELFYDAEFGLYTFEKDENKNCLNNYIFKIQQDTNKEKKI